MTEEFKFPVSESKAMFIGYFEAMMEMVDAGFTREEACQMTLVFIKNGFDNAILEIDSGTDE